MHLLPTNAVWASIALYYAIPILVEQMQPSVTRYYCYSGTINLYILSNIRNKHIGAVVNSFVEGQVQLAMHSPLHFSLLDHDMP